MNTKPHGNTGRRNAAKPESERADSQINSRCKLDDRTRWQKAAKLQDLTTSEWIIKTLNHCSSKEYLDAEEISEKISRQYFE